MCALAGERASAPMRRAHPNRPHNDRARQKHSLGRQAHFIAAADESTRLAGPLLLDVSHCAALQAAAAAADSPLRPSRARTKWSSFLAVALVAGGRPRALQTSATDSPRDLRQAICAAAAGAATVAAAAAARARASMAPEVGHGEWVLVGGGCCRRRRCGDNAPLSSSPVVGVVVFVANCAVVAAGDSATAATAAVAANAAAANAAAAAAESTATPSAATSPFASGEPLGPASGAERRSLARRSGPYAARRAH